MAMAQDSGQVFPFDGRTGSLGKEDQPSWLAASGAGMKPVRAAERQQALDAVHDALSAAMTADTALCRLRLHQTLNLCTDRPHAAWAARQELGRLLRLDIVARHLSACEKRRRLLRELEELAACLRQIAAPEVV